jgi:hypothetical protein
MPLNTQEDYERLGEHLFAIDAPLANFAAAHGYTVYPPLSGGRYPDRRITQEGIICRSIHIAMAEQPSGERFDHFFPEIPYTIFGGAWIDDHQHYKRWHSAFLNTRNIPFSLLITTLPLYLDHFHNYLSSITADHIYTCACTTALELPYDKRTQTRVY